MHASSAIKLEASHINNG